MTRTRAELLALPGYRSVQRSRETGTLVAIFNGDEQQVESGWYTECVEHSVVVVHETYRTARYMAPSPCTWCEACADEHGEAH